MFSNIIILLGYIKNNFLNKSGGKLTKSLFGNKDNACVVNTNNNNSNALIAAYSPESQIATYPYRDHVISYKHFRTQPYTAYTPSNFTATSVDLDDVSTVKVGSIIDLYVDSTLSVTGRFSGIVNSINGNTVTVNAWYENDDTSAGQIPSGVTIAYVDLPTIVWVNNDNVFLQADGITERGYISEYGMFNRIYDADTHPNAVINGIYITSNTGKSQFGFKINGDGNSNVASYPVDAGFWATNCLYGFIAEKCQYAFQARDSGGSSTIILYGDGTSYFKGAIDARGGVTLGALGTYALDVASGKFNIDTSGRITAMSLRSTSYSVGANLNMERYLHVISIGGITLTVPVASATYSSRTIKIFNVTASTATVNMNSTNYTIPAKKSVELWCDGSLWYDLSNILT